MLNFIFSSAGFNDAVKRIAYLKSYRSYRERQVANIFRTQNLLQTKTASLSENKKQKSQHPCRGNNSFRAVTPAAPEAKLRSRFFL